MVKDIKTLSELHVNPKKVNYTLELCMLQSRSIQLHILPNAKSDYCLCAHKNNCSTQP